MPGLVDKAVSVAPSFSLKLSMQEADAAAESADGNEEANIPLNLEGKARRSIALQSAVPHSSPRTSSSQPDQPSGSARIRSLSEPASLFSTIPGLRTAISMCSSSPSHCPSPSTVPSPSSPLAGSTVPPNTNPSAPRSSLYGSSNLRRPSGNNRRTNRKRSQKRAEKAAAAERDREVSKRRVGLSFRRRILEKYGIVKNQVPLKSFSAPRFLHAVGAWIGVRALEMAKLAGWTVTQLIIWQAFTLIQWDGRCVAHF